MGGVNSTEKWHWDGNTGNIRFSSCDETRQYAIITKPSQSSNEDKGPDEILKSLMKKWDLQTPNVLISVTGGAKGFDMVTHKRTIFKRELIKLARKIDMWVVSGGSDCGIMKEVGEAVRDANFLKSNSVVAIGIATFGVVAYREALRKTVDKDEVYSTPTELNMNENETCLDPNHTHFLLVDDGTQKQFGKEITFRTGIEIAVSKLRTAKTEAMVPVVLLVVEGGPNTIRTVTEAVRGGIPTVLIKGSGKAADVLALACECAEKPKPERKKWETEYQKLSGVTEELGLAVQECVEKRHLIKVFDMTDTTNIPSDMGDVILTALKDVERENKDLSQLKLTLYWNRIDTARDIMRHITRDKLKTVFEDEDMITTALVLDRFDFMEIFLDKGKDMTSYLTRGMLQTLYQEIPKDSSLRNILWKLQNITRLEKDETCLENIGKLISHLLGKFYDVHPMYTKTDTMTLSDTTDNPFLHLMVWCILTHRHEMTKLFWKYGKDQVAAALVAYGLLKKMALMVENKDIETSMNNNADEFCQLAQTMLSRCKESNEKKTTEMLSKRMDNWGNATCRQIARMTENRSFVAHPFFQSLLSEEWMGELSLLNRWKWVKFPLCIIPPMQLLIPCLIRFKDDDQKEQRNSKSSTSTSCCGRSMCPCEKIMSFYKAPVVKFVGNSMIYVAFLMLFAYTLLSKFDTNLTVFEVALAVCVTVFFFDELLQLKSTGPETYFRNKWNYFDISGVILFVGGFCLYSYEPTLGLGRMICSLSFVCLSLSLIGMFSLHENIGPQLQMIKMMTFDLISFLAILLVCVITYAIAAYANLYPASKIDRDLIINLLRIPYWNLYGELNLEVFEMKEPDCSFDRQIFENGTLPRCPTTMGTYLVPLLMGFYMLFASVLLLNLLIAMFSNSYAKVQAETHLHWCYQRLTLIHECSSRPRIPLPFRMTSKVLQMFCCCFLSCNKCRRKTNYEAAAVSDPTDDKKCNSLTLWEKAVANEFLQDLRKL
ncbi:transient receptor potential cation channel subfamily M member-like 2 [Pecten maximus]|uniref:transient receptor potential cation channel subfamily M member-like 2 n=1 Tax=Pecten maximus TaxID=6579 RepID=UPI0014584890|nr:transient receptor potential cation channel subfamily M member-like 2 [Pecten maximus]